MTGAENDSVKIAKLQVEMENIKEIVKDLSTKFDRFLDKFDQEQNKWADKAELRRVEEKAIKNRWVSNVVTAVLVEVITLLVINFIQHH